jgi:hypothetical protein
MTTPERALLIACAVSIRMMAQRNAGCTDVIQPINHALDALSEADAMAAREAKKAS